jgi:hypothetical protein
MTTNGTDPMIYDLSKITDLRAARHELQTVKREIDTAWGDLEDALSTLASPDADDEALDLAENNLREVFIPGLVASLQRAAELVSTLTVS